MTNSRAPAKLTVTSSGPSAISLLAPSNSSSESFQHHFSHTAVAYSSSASIEAGYCPDRTLQDSKETCSNSHNMASPTSKSSKTSSSLSSEAAFIPLPSKSSKRSQLSDNHHSRNSTKSTSSNHIPRTKRASLFMPLHTNKPLPDIPDEQSYQPTFKISVGSSSNNPLEPISTQSVAQPIINPLAINSSSAAASNTTTSAENNNSFIKMGLIKQLFSRESPNSKSTPTSPSNIMVAANIRPKIGLDSVQDSNKSAAGSNSASIVPTSRLRLPSHPTQTLDNSLSSSSQLAPRRSIDGSVLRPASSYDTRQPRNSLNTNAPGLSSDTSPKKNTSLQAQQQSSPPRTQNKRPKKPQIEGTDTLKKSKPKNDDIPSSPKASKDRSSSKRSSRRKSMSLYTGVDSIISSDLEKMSLKEPKPKGGRKRESSTTKSRQSSNNKKSNLRKNVQELQGKAQC